MKISISNSRNDIIIVLSLSSLSCFVLAFPSLLDDTSAIMTGDASLPPNAPMTNGTLTPDVHGEADASSAQAEPRQEGREISNAEGQPGTGEQGARRQGTDDRASSLRDVCADINARVTAFLTVPSDDDDTLRRTQEHTKVALGVIEQALQDYAFEHLSLSYNGGKDCLVLLLLYLSVLHNHFSTQNRERRKTDQKTGQCTYDTQGFPTSIPSIYAKPPDPFPLVTEFVDSSSTRYHLSLIHISTNPGQDPKSKSHSSPPPTANPIPTSSPPTSPNQAITFRDAFSLYLSHHHPTCQAIFVGTRRTDPHGATLSSFAMTDGLWPRFMRIHPVLEWGLAEIWTFLRQDCIRYGVHDGNEKEKEGREMIDYCKMYDQGYTSLGGVNDTHRNPKLRDEGAEGGFRPAYSMTEDVEERLGRE
jgi:FAD synthetase